MGGITGMGKNKIEFSARGVIESALVNLAESRIGSEKFALALYEISDFSALRELVKNRAEALSSSEKGGLLKSISGAGDAGGIVSAICENISDANISKDIMRSVSAEIISNIDKSKLLFAGGGYCVEIEKISDFFGLEEVDKRLIAFLFAWDKTSGFKRICDDACRDASQSKLFAFFAEAVNSKQSEVSASIKRLRDKNIVEKPSRDAFPLLENEICEYISEFDGSGVAERFSQRLDPETNFRLSSFPIDSGDVKIIGKMLKSGEPHHILFYGEEGECKREFAKALAKSLRRGVYVPNREGGCANLTRTNIAAAMFAAGGGKSIALIDGADEFLESLPARIPPIPAGKANSGRKGAANSLLDGAKGPVIWIANGVESIDKSTLARFSYSLRFDGISERQKEIVIKSGMAKNKIGKKFFPQVKAGSKRYGLSAEGIGLVLDKAAGVSSGDSELAMNIEKIARAHYELLSNRKSSRGEFKVDWRFDASILNIDFPMESLSRTLENYKSAAGRAGESPLSFLFSGAAGTGKTQLGRFIAGELGRELVVKRMSEISSCYVGETEKNIRKMFREASRDGAALMIDEADSLFYNRQSARRPWEVSQVNEILAQMEMFAGVVICTTNLADNMDAAAMRRFNWKIKFSPPTFEGRVKLYSKYFLDGKTPAKEVEGELYSLDGLCPGDFYSVWQKTRFAPEKTDSLVIAALKTELSYKKDVSCSSSRIGFC